MTKRLNEEIDSRLTALADAKIALANVAARVQSSCKHEIAAETGYQSSGFNARRICLHCRLEEEGSHWSGGGTWSYVDHSRKPTLGNDEDRIITNVDRDAFYKLRLPVQVPE
ncbi:hypothetical protein [Mesorhizobium sp. M0146]|uniref:hypothetical protein n=1 Tax=unclassified Mesorhizobium TaxID=325217 RepID=UPI00333789EF